MKRYETMSKEKIVKLLTDCNKSATCKNCPAHGYGIDTTSICCVTRYLNSEVKMVPRWKTAKTQEDMNHLCKEFEKICRNSECSSCFAPGSKKALNQCYHAFLSEPVEVKE